MSYQVLARKWRPSTFHELVGQDHVLRALVNALDSDRLHHAYLFTGTRGVGKTSIARLFAKSLNCEQGVTSTPCGQCSPCRDIGEGRFVDLIEVDAASRTKVEDTRELMENVQYAPTQGRYKVYLIDEVHMLSTHSFNALLKTLEEPPPHIKFLLATTDPQKLPVTILSRCLQFNLKNMTPERIVAHLQRVLEAEQVANEEPALWLLARAANGSMRDAMSLTDQAIAYGSGSLVENDVRTMLGTVDQQQVLGLLEQLAKSSAEGVMTAVAALAEFGVDYDSLLAELLGLLHRVALAQMLPQSIDNSQGDRDAVLALAQAMRAEDVQLYYQIALNGRKDLPLVPVARDGLEMTLLRMLAFRPVGAGEVALPQGQSAQVRDQRAAAAATAEMIPSQPSVAAAMDKPATVPEPEASAPVVESGPVVDEVDDAPPWGEPSAESAPAPAPVPAEPARAPEDPPKKPEPPEPANAVEASGKGAETAIPLGLEQVDAHSWIALLEAIDLSGMTYNIAANAGFEGLEGNQMHFLLSAHQVHLFNATHQQRIEDALSRHFSTPVRVVVKEGVSEQETPAQYHERRRMERQAEAVEALEQDENVRMMIERFDARLEPDSIRPIDPAK